jgi:hypothetical protein
MPGRAEEAIPAIRGLSRVEADIAALANSEAADMPADQGALRPSRADDVLGGRCNLVLTSVRRSWCSKRACGPDGDE